MRADGAGPRQVITEPNQQAHNPVASSDGRLVAFSSDRSGALEVWVMAIDGNNVRQVTRTGNASGPHFTADGRSIVFSRLGRGVWEVPVTGSDPTRLFDAPGSSGFPRTAAALALSPDGRFLCFATKTKRTAEIAPRDLAWRRCMAASPGASSRPDDRESSRVDS